MKTIDKIPTSKIQRASKLFKTGAKVGVNYIKYYGEKIVRDEDKAKERLNKNNAEDIYDGLKNLKGSALKVAQMLSMDKSILPEAYVEKFSLSQFSVPPLSAPLVLKTFKSNLGKTPYEIFDEFNPNSVNAASIGQVHLAVKNNKKLEISNLIQRSIEIKNEVVLQDPKEQNLRKILNFGHTLGHAIESFYLESEDKENLTHGEAIAIGMVCESFMSSKLLGFPTEKVNEIKDVILSIYDRTNLLKEDFSDIIELLKHDKKNINGQVNFVLLNDYEDYKIDCKVPEELILESMEFYNE